MLRKNIFLTMLSAFSVFTFSCAVHAQETRLDRVSNAVLNKTLVNDLNEQGRQNDGVENNTIPSMPELHAKFQKLLTGAKFTGQFTVDGKPLTDLQEETYEIEKVEKLPEGDMWVITTRIKYGKTDLKVPVPLEVKWAGSTPVLTLDSMTIPGLGTFGARVVLHKNKYAGTWQHDDAGGHLFGKIELAKK